MKRKRCDTIPESSTPSPFPTSIHRVGIPVTRPDSRSTQADGPKTSEYAFFKKLKTDAGQRFGSHLKQREKNLSNKVNYREGGRVVESTNIVRNCSKEFSSPLSVGDVSSKRLESLLSIRNASCEVSRSPLPINNVMHCNFDSFVSPVDRADNNPEINLKKAVSAFEETCNIEVYLEQNKTNKRQDGSQSGKVDLFSRKRQKLYQWAYRSFPEMDNSKRYDLIPVLLNRLLPWGNEEKCFQSTEPLQVENNSKTELLTCSKSDVPSNKPYRMPLKNIMDVDNMPNVENSTSSYWSGRSRETTLSNCCYPTYNNHGSLENNLELPSCKLRGKNLISCTEENSAFGFPFVRHGSFSPFKEPDEYYDFLQLKRIPSNLELPRCELRGKSLISCDEENSFGFPFVRHGSFLPFSHFKEPDEYYDLLQLKRIPSNLDLPSCKLRGKSLMSCNEENYAFDFPFVRRGSFLPFSPFKEPDEYYDLLQLKRIPSNLELPNCKLRGESLISCDEENFAFGFPFVRHGSFPPFNPIKEPDEYYDPNRCLLGTEPQLLLLDCDSVNVNERSLSFTSQNANWAIIPEVQNSWDHQQSLDNCCESFATVGLCPLPIMENYPQNFSTLKPSNGSVYDKHEFGRILLEEAIVADSKHLPFTSSQSPEAFNLIAGSTYYGVAYKDRETNYILPSPVNHLVFLDEAFGEENSASFTEPHLSFALDVESKYLRPSGLRRYPCSSTCNDLHFHEKEMMHSNFLGEDEFGSSSGGLSCRRLICFSDDITKIHDSKSFYRRISQDEDKVYPFLDDDSSWEGCTEEAYACGNEGKSL